MNASFTAILTKSCVTLASSVFLKVGLSYLVSAGLTEHKCEIFSINLLISDGNCGQAVFDPIDLLFALWASVLAVSQPLIDALVTVNVVAGVQRCHFVLFNYFETYRAALFIFLFAHAGHRLPVVLDSPTQLGSRNAHVILFFRSL